MSIINYKLLDYIESTGTQYVDTLVPMSSLTKVVIEGAFQQSSINIQGLFGRYSTSNGYQITYNSSTQKFSGRWKSNSSSTESDFLFHKFILSNSNFIVDNTTIAQFSDTKISDTSSLYIFARRKDSSGSGIQTYSCFKMYSCKLYDNDVLVSDFVPVLDTNDVACLYDKVTNQFYYNQGTGTFNAGNIIGTYTNLIYDRTQEDVDYALNNPDSESYNKGAYNYTDLNRIEEWCEYIAQQLNLYGYGVSITTKTDWEMTDFPTKTETRRILANIQTLIDAFDPNIEGASDLNILYFEKMTYQKANKIEEILSNLYTLFNNMLVSFRYSGTFYSGESEGLL